jgi:hypothetical protein
LPTFSALQAQLRRATFDVTAKGVAPIHRRAVANARRLGRVCVSRR